VSYAKKPCTSRLRIVHFPNPVAIQPKPTPLFYTCLTSWLTELGIAKLMNTALVPLAFNSLLSDDLFDAVVNFIVALIRETRQVYDNVDSIKVLYDQLREVSPKLATLGTDPDTLRGIIRIYAEAGEVWAVLLAHEPENYLFLVQSLAQYTEYKEDIEVTKVTFNFWYELTQLITVEKHKHAKELFQPIYEGLVDVMIEKLHYPDCLLSDVFFGDRVSEDKFRDFRHEIGDVLKDCCRVVGGSRCLGKAYSTIQWLLEEQAQREVVRWQDIEALLFSIRMMAKEVVNEESEVVPEVIKLLVNLPEHDKMRYAANLGSRSVYRMDRQASRVPRISAQFHFVWV
jgi:transportin-3